MTHVMRTDLLSINLFCLLLYSTCKETYAVMYRLLFQKSKKILIFTNKKKITHEYTRIHIIFFLLVDEPHTCISKSTLLLLFLFNALIIFLK